jgi:hypothetical protein
MLPYITVPSQASLWGLDHPRRLTFLTYFLRMILWFFCGANVDHMFSLKALLICFKAISGLKVNMTELALVPVGNVDNVVELAGTLGCVTSSLPLKYLGLPLGAHFKAKATRDGIVEKVERQLASWKEYICLRVVGLPISKALFLT